MIYCKEHGNYKGMCCCNCKHQTVVKKHPWNKGDGKGSVKDIMGFACCNPMDAEHGQIIFMDKQHSMCELHEDKVNK
jgi:hypothetical protein